MVLFFLQCVVPLFNSSFIKNVLIAKCSCQSIIGNEAAPCLLLCVCMLPWCIFPLSNRVIHSANTVSFMLLHPIGTWFFIYSPPSLLAIKFISKQSRWMPWLLYSLEISCGWWNVLGSRGWGLCCSSVENLPSTCEALDLAPAPHKEV